MAEPLGTGVSSTGRNIMYSGHGAMSSIEDMVSAARDWWVFLAMLVAVEA
jgi:hypothetical protein